MFIGSVRVAIVGATGAVGRVMLKVLEEREFPLAELHLCASSRSRGKTIPFRGQDIGVKEVSEDLLAECDIVFISATDEISDRLPPIAVRHGCIVIDDSAVWRMNPDVPLVIPEVNGKEIGNHRGIISIPNCSTTQMVMVLWPLHCHNPIKRVVVSTYQAVSGTGAKAMEELLLQSRQILAGEIPTIEQYPHQIAFNLFLQIGSVKEDGYYSEERKMLQETRKIMGMPGLAVSATCVRVPVLLSHSEAIHVEFVNPILPGDARGLLQRFPGVSVIDVPDNGSYPIPIDVAGKDGVFVGRIRQAVGDPRALLMWVVSDNLRKGAATNAVQIAEELVRRKLLLR